MRRRENAKGAGLWARLQCLVRGHVPHRYNGTFYIACERCDKTLNFRTGVRRG